MNLCLAEQPEVKKSLRLLEQNTSKNMVNNYSYSINDNAEVVKKGAGFSRSAPAHISQKGIVKHELH